MIPHPKRNCLVLAFLVSVTGCQTTPAVRDTAAKQKMLELLMPSRIEIVEPFTRIKSFDKDTKPDGIELLVQAVNSLDNPGLMIAGDVRVELFSYVPASGDRKGPRLEYWKISLSTEQQQRTYWNQITQMYEFWLQVDPTVLPLEDKYLLTVTYSSPLGEHLTAESVIEYRTPGRSLGAGR